MIITFLESIFVGKPQPFAQDGIMSAMARSPINGPILLTQLGLVGDQVADTVHHGGADKALHLYPPEHYPFWQAKLGGHRLLDSAGAFGENISASGMTEKKIKIGDRFRIGSALVEVSHGRQPCWKIDHRFGVHGLSREVIRSGRCGLYFRVIEEGKMASGDTIEQTFAAQHHWTVERVFALLIAGGHRGDEAQHALAELAALETLALVWRQRAEQLMG